MAKSAMVLSAISAFSLVFSFLQEAVLAYYFGTSMETDAYTIAIQLPVIVFSVVSTSISTIIIPNYSKKYFGEGKKSAERYASNFITSISLITIFIVIICEIYAYPMMRFFAPGLDINTQELTVNLFRIVLPTIILTELMNINMGILNVHKSFVLPALTSNILNISFVGFVFALATKIGITAAIIGTTIGTCLEFLYTLILRRRYMKYKLYFNLKDEMMIKSIKMAVPVFIGIGADEISKIVDKMISSFLIAGSISALNYASKLSSAVSSLLITGISTVIYPEFAKNAASDDKQGLATTLVYSLKLYIIIIFPIIAGGMILSSDIISVVFQRGTFDELSVNRTAPLFSCYLVCLLFTAIRTASSRFFYAQGNSKTPMKNSVIGIAINIFLNIVLVRIFDALGLALATTISMGIIALLIMIDAKKINQYICFRDLWIVTLKVVFACILMVITLLGIKYFLPNLVQVNRNGKLTDLLFVTLSVVFGGGVYFLALILLKTSEVKDFILQFRKKRS